MVTQYLGREIEVKKFQVFANKIGTQQYFGPAAMVRSSLQ